jgi:hypothetical protein
MRPVDSSGRVEGGNQPASSVSMLGRALPPSRSQATATL